MEAGIAANSAEERKRRKCAALAEEHQFEPIAVETMGVYGESTGVIVRAIGRRLVEATGEPREANWLLLFSEARGSGGVALYPTPHFVPEGISSSIKDFTVLVFNFEVFHIKFSEK